jgi:hypothetical protein
MDPKYFGRIMSYVRSGDLSYDGLNSKECAEFNKVLEYFELRAPVADQSAPSWDPEYCGDKLLLQSNNLVVSGRNSGMFKSKNSNTSQGVLSAQSCSKYSVQILKGKYIMIGFAPRHGFEKNGDSYRTCGWFLSVYNGRLFSQGGVFNKPYGDAIPERTVVTAIHDRNQNTIEFHIDGRSLGIAFSNITPGKLYAAASIGHDSELRIMDKSNQARRKNSRNNEQLQMNLITDY